MSKSIFGCIDMYADLNFSNITFFFRGYSFHSPGWEAKAFESMGLTVSWTLTAVDAGNRYIALSFPLSLCSLLSPLLFSKIAHTHILRNSGCCIATCNARRSAAALGFDGAKNSGRLAGKRIGNDAPNMKGHDSLRTWNGSFWMQTTPLGGHSVPPLFYCASLFPRN